jgi:transposase InsO family protein/transposase-like protein
MYSYEDRIRAVKLYLKMGKRIRVTIRQLGFPTKNSLISWHRQYERLLDLPVAYSRPRSKYSDEQRVAAVEHYVSHGCCIAYTMRALGYPGRDMLTTWVREAYPDTMKRFVGRVRNPQLELPLKQAAVVELCTRDGSALAIAEEVGVNRTTLYNWKNQLLGREAPASMERKSEPASNPERAELERELESLRGDIRKLKLERDLLKKAAEVLKKGLGIDLTLLTNREKAKLVDALREIHAVPELLTELGLARSSYFYHRLQMRGTEKYAETRRTIANVFEANHRCYGYRRIRASLNRESICISEKVVQRLMKEAHLVAATPKRRRYSSYQGEIGPAPENMLNRDFQAAAPNEKWVTDISEFQIPAGKVYLSPMIDCFDGMVVSWSISTRPDADLVNSMLDAAIETVPDGKDGTVVHSDRGGHYRWPGWLSRVDHARMVRSMSRKACSPDNAACEGFFGRLKTELFYPRNWQGTTVEHFIEALDSYIRWYNEKRIKLSLGALSPIEYRESLGLVR